MSTRLYVSAAALVLFAVGMLALAIGLSADRAGGSGESGDTLLRAYGNDPDTLNPLLGGDSVSSAFQRQVYEGLADREFADPDTWVPVLATDWEFDDQTREFTIHLRQGVFWHPLRLPGGEWLPKTEFTARDVKFTFDCILNPHAETASTRSYYEDPDAEDDSQRYKIVVTVVDKYTVKIRWRKPYFLAKEFTLGVPLIPRHVYSVDENGDPVAFNMRLKEFADAFNKHWANGMMCGTGPLMYQRYERNQKLVLVRNPDYWGKPYHFDRVVYRCIPNTNTMQQKVLQGSLDLCSVPDKDKWFQLKDDPRVESGAVTLVNYEYPGYRYIGYNLNFPFFKDKRVRQALSHAVPVDRIIDKLFKGLAVPTSGPFQPGSSTYNPEVKPVPYDLQAARRLLDEAGWNKFDDDGFRYKVIENVKVSARFDFMIFADSRTFGTIAEMLKEECRKIGVDVQLSTTKWALMLEKLNNRTFDATMLGWNASWRSDPKQLWHSSNADVPYSSNFVSYRNEKVDEKIETLHETMDEDKQIPIYREIHRLIAEDQPYTFLFAENQTAAYDSRLRSVDAEGRKTDEPLRFYKLRPCMDSREWYATRSRAQR